MKNGKSNVKWKETKKSNKEWWLEKERNTQLKKEKYVWNIKPKKEINTKRKT